MIAHDRYLTYANYYFKNNCQYHIVDIVKYYGSESYLNHCEVVQKADARKMRDEFLRCLFCWGLSSLSLLAKKNVLNQFVLHIHSCKGFAETLEPDT